MRSIKFHLQPILNSREDRSRQRSYMLLYARVPGILDRGVGDDQANGKDKVNQAQRRRRNHAYRQSRTPIRKNATN